LLPPPMLGDTPSADYMAAEAYVLPEGGMAPVKLPLKKLLLMAEVGSPPVTVLTSGI